MVDSEPLLSIEQAAAFLGVPPDSLRYWRIMGRGPVSILIGRHVRYVPADLRAWVETQRAKAVADQHDQATRT